MKMIEISKTKNRRAVIISFCTHSDKFRSASERNTFFRGLYGWEQVVTKNDKRYRYRREGILTEIPHIKVDDSVFIVALEHFKKVLKYFEEWSNKVDWEVRRIILEDDDFD